MEPALLKLLLQTLENMREDLKDLRAKIGDIGIAVARMEATEVRIEEFETRHRAEHDALSERVDALESAQRNATAKVSAWISVARTLAKVPWWNVFIAIGVAYVALHNTDAGRVILRGTLP